MRDLTHLLNLLALHQRALSRWDRIANYSGNNISIIMQSEDAHYRALPIRARVAYLVSFIQSLSYGQS